MRTIDLRSQLYSSLRSAGKSSTLALTKPRFKNQCSVLVVRTKSFLSPDDLALASIRFNKRSPSPDSWASGSTAKHESHQHHLSKELEQHIRTKHGHAQ